MIYWRIIRQVRLLFVHFFGHSANEINIFVENYITEERLSLELTWHEWVWACTSCQKLSTRFPDFIQCKEREKKTFSEHFHFVCCWLQSKLAGCSTKLLYFLRAHVARIFIYMHNQIAIFFFSQFLSSPSPSLPLPFLLSSSASLFFSKQNSKLLCVCWLNVGIIL